MNWTRIVPIGDGKCATEGCSRSARWHGAAGDVGSDYCSECRDSIDVSEIVAAARGVIWFDWSDSDADAVAAIERLRKAVASSGFGGTK